MKSSTRFVVIVGSLVAFGALAGVAQAASRRGPRQTVRAGRSRAQTQTRLAGGLGRSSGQPLRAGSARGGLSGRVAQQVQQVRREMEKTIRDEQATPPFEVVAKQQGVRLRETRASDYHAGIWQRVRVDGTLAGGKLDLVALLPVSGHVGWANAQSYARSNQYNVTFEAAGGQEVALPRVSSTGLVTQTHLSLALKPGSNFVRFWADGSARVGGFPSGRTIEIVYKQ
jgi:hypothetical protein